MQKFIFLLVFLVAPNAWAQKSRGLEEEVVKSEYCQVSTASYRCGGNCKLRRPVSCFTKNGIISGYVDPEAMLSQYVIDGKLTQVEKTIEKFLDDKSEIPTKVEVYAFTPGTKIYAVDQVEDTEVVHEIGAGSFLVPQSGADLAMKKGSPKHFSCLYKGEMKKRCLNFFETPSDARFLTRTSEFPAITEAAGDPDCEVDASVLYTQALQELKAQKLMVVTGTQAPSADKTKLTPIQKPFSLNLNKLNLDIEVKYEKNIFHIDPGQVYFHKIQVGSHEFSIRDLAKYASEEELKYGLNHHVNFSDAPPIALKRLLQAALKDKKLTESQIDKLLAKDVVVSPGKISSNGEITYNRNLVPELYSAGNFDVPATVCPGAAKGDYFHRQPVEYATELCDEPIIMGEYPSKDGSLKRVGCFAPKETAGQFNAIYCPKPSTCLKDGYSKNKFEAVEVPKQKSNQGSKGAGSNTF